MLSVLLLYPLSPGLLQEQVAIILPFHSLSRPKSRESTPKPAETNNHAKPATKEEPVQAQHILPEQPKPFVSLPMGVIPANFYPGGHVAVSMPMMVGMPGTISMPGTMPVIPSTILEKPPPPVAILPAADEKPQVNFFFF